MNVLFKVSWKDVTKEFLRSDRPLRFCCPVAVALNSILHSSYKAVVDNSGARIVFDDQGAFKYEHFVEFSDEMENWVRATDVYLAREDEVHLRSLFPKSFVLSIPEKYIFGIKEELS